MLKMVISDYRMDFKRIVKETKASDWAVRLMVMEYFCFMITLYSDGRLLGQGKQRAWSVVLYIIMALFLGMGSFHSNSLGKMFYLIPVSEEDRRKYLLTGYWFRILLAISVTGCCVAAGVVFSGVPLLQAVLILGHFFMMMCNIHCYFNVPWESGQEKPVQWQYRATYAEFIIFQSWENHRHMRWRYYLSCLVTVAGVFLTVYAVAGRYQHWAYALVTVVQVVLTAVLCILYWKNDKELC